MTKTIALNQGAEGTSAAGFGIPGSFRTRPGNICVRSSDMIFGAPRMPPGEGESTETLMTYTLNETQEMARALRALPAMDAAKQRLTKQAVVRHLVDEIASLQQRGYTIEQVVESLRGVGLAIATPTLKSYLQRAKKKPGKERPRKPKPSPAPTPGRAREVKPTPAAAEQPKAEAALERTGKQAFLVKDKDSY
jgi:hypothetical protein